MSQHWAILFGVAEPKRLDAAIESLGQLRLLEDTLICQTGELLWVRGPQRDAELTAVLQSLPCTNRFVMTHDGMLTKFGERTPSGTIPDVEWTSLRNFIEPQLPVTAIRRVRIPRVPMTLVRATKQRPVEPTALLVSAKAAAEWVAMVPQDRIEPLSFAASSDGQILFKGKPFPSLPETRLTDQKGVLVPTG